MRNRLRISLFVMLFTSPIVAGFGVYNYFQDRQVLSHGATTTGTVTSQYIEQNGQRSSAISYYLSVAYSVGSNSFHENFQVAERKYQTHPKGSEIRVHYLPSNPHIAMIGKSLWLPIATIVAGVSMFLISLAYHLYQKRRSRSRSEA